MANSMIHVEVVYALPQKQQIVSLELPEGSTARDAINRCGLDAQFEGLDLKQVDVGIFGKVVQADTTVLANGDRVEIYRPLIADPKEVRKQRAAKVKARQEAEGRR